MDLGLCGRELVLKLVDPGLGLGQRGRGDRLVRRGHRLPGRGHDHAAGDGQQHRAGHHEQGAVQRGQPHPHGAAAARLPAAFSFLASPLVCLPRQAAAPAAPPSRPPGCPAGPNNGITARVRPVLAPLPYNRAYGSNDRSTRPAQELRPGAGAGRHDVHRRAGAGDRVHRPERGRQDHHDAGDPRPGRPRRGHRPGRRPPLRQPAVPAAPCRLPAGRRRAAAQPHRPQPPALAGALPGPGRRAGSTR